MRLAWRGFLPWLEVKHPTQLPQLELALESIASFSDDIRQEAFTKLLDNAACACTMQLFQVYLESLQNQHNLSSFWMSYIDITEIMLGLIRATREGNWMLHLACIREIIPWCFAYDKLNYAHFLPYYYAMMKQLPVDHPDVHEHFS